MILRTRTISVLLIIFTLLSFAACERNNDSDIPDLQPESSTQELESEDGVPPLPTADESESSVLAENYGFFNSDMQASATDETVFGIDIFHYKPNKNELIARDLESYIFEDVGTYLYIAPRFAGSSIVIERIEFDESRNEFLPADTLFETTATNNYALLLQADLSEGGPRLRVTVSIDDKAASYEPVYDGRGDTIYPVEKNGVLLVERSSSIPTDLPGTSVQADFQRPEYLHYAISNIAYDEAAETYAILYAVSNYDGDKDWQTYDNVNSDIHIQLFDKQGSFLRKIETDLAPIKDSNAEVIPSEPCIFHNGMLTFFSGLPQKYIFFDIADETYTEVSAERCTTDRDYFLFDDGGLSSGSSTGAYVYSLYNQSNLVSSITIQVEDISFKLPGNRTYQGERSDTFSLDSQSMTAVIGNDKLTYYLDFNTGTWRMERHYNRDHLEKLIATSPDGQWEIYLADSGGAGEGRWADVVSLETSSGAITYLTDYYSLSAVFCSDTMLLLNRTSSIELIDVEKGQVIDEQFAIDCAAKECYINGIAYDADNDWLLVAWRSPKDGPGNDRSAKVPLMLDIYSLDGSLVKTMDTGYGIMPFSRSGHMIGLTLIPDGNGSIDMIDNFEVTGDKHFGAVKYS